VAEFKTLQFANTPAGQAEKTKTLARESAEGWRVVSETIQAGDFKKEKACLLFLVCAPLAFLAGNQEGVITVTLQRG
jgi:hypothetical protein